MLYSSKQTFLTLKIVPDLFVHINDVISWFGSVHVIATGYMDATVKRNSILKNHAVQF